MKEYRTEYTVRKWTSPEQLTVLLNQLINEGWHADTHRLNGNDEGGWTVFRKTTLVMPDMMEAKMPLSEIWRITNSTAVFDAASIPVRDAYHNPVVEEIVKQIKDYYNKNAESMQ